MNIMKTGMTGIRKNGTKIAAMIMPATTNKVQKIIVSMLLISF